jgi:hypothetical protein
MTDNLAELLNELLKSGPVVAADGFIGAARLAVAMERTNELS